MGYNPSAKYAQDAADRIRRLAVDVVFSISSAVLRLCCGMEAAGRFLCERVSKWRGGR